MHSAHYFAACTLVLLSACGGGSQGPTGPAPVSTIALTATAPSVMRQGAAVDISAALKGLSGPLTWSLAPGAPGTLTDHADKLGATYIPVSSTPDAAPEKITITASAGAVSQSIQLDLKPAPKPVSYLALPKVWTYGPLNDVGYPISGNPVASAADQSGNLYLAYSAPVSEIKKISTDGSITAFAHVGHPGSLAFGPNGVLYVVDGTGIGAYAIRLIAPDGTTSTLTQTAPYDNAKGTVDGPPGVATAVALSIAVSRNGTVYATDLTRVRKIAPDGSFSTIAGGGCEYFSGLGCPGPAVDGHGTEARFVWPSSIAIDAAGNLYVSDIRAVRKITPAGDVSTLAGTQGPVAISDSPDLDGTGSAARFSTIERMAMDPAGNIYVLGGRMLRKITPAGAVSTVATAVGGFFPITPERNITSLYAGVPGVVFLQSSDSLSKVAVD